MTVEMGSQQMMIGAAAVRRDDVGRCCLNDERDGRRSAAPSFPALTPLP
ncbi:hypothetical protein [Stenotrophomonas sp. SY1]|nr:hypothetical protein [Stenotrophomonas sp. SY1]MCD9086223.1 hypothetical protein [Stenotrophomonas sp. SY1]